MHACTCDWVFPVPSLGNSCARPQDCAAFAALVQCQEVGLAGWSRNCEEELQRSAVCAAWSACWLSLPLCSAAVAGERN